MKIEHIALNVPDALAMGRWYGDHLGLTVKRRTMEEPWAHFLADDGGTVMIEIYTNRDVEIPDYHAIPPANMHLAFVSRDPRDDAMRLRIAGATVVVEHEALPGGDEMAMLRDPWGIPLQLIKRSQPML